jgi:hypothetical protein
MSNTTNQPGEALEAQLTNDLKHTLKLVPQSQRELFVFELARYLASHQTAHTDAVVKKLEAAKMVRGTAPSPMADESVRVQHQALDTAIALVKGGEVK